MQNSLYRNKEYLLSTVNNPSDLLFINMSTENKQNRATFDLVIVVDDIDAIKIWTEQIECAVAGLQPKYHVARSGMRHLDRNKDRFKTCKKMLFMLDIKHQTFQSRMMKDWIQHFKGLRKDDVMCVLVNSDATNSVDMTQCSFLVAPTDNIANFHTWWPKMVEFLFFKTKAAPKKLNYSLVTVHTHEDDQLPYKLTQCLDAFVDPTNTRFSKNCQSVKLVGGAYASGQEREENVHVVLTSLRVDLEDFTSCNSVHSRTEVLRCVLFILIDSGILPLRRFSRCRLKNSKPLMFLLSLFVFILNLPTAVLIMFYGFVPGFGILMSFHMFKKADKLVYVMFAAVLFLIPFVLMGSLELKISAGNIRHQTCGSLFVVFSFYLSST